MAISQTTLTASGSTTDGTSFTTASIDSKGWPILAFISLSQTTTGPSVPTLSSTTGTGTWTAIGTGWTLSSATARGQYAILGTNLTAASTIVITKNASEVPTLYQGAAASDADWDLIDTVTCTFASTPKVNSRIYSAAQYGSATDGLTPGTGLTTIENHAQGTPQVTQKTAYTAGLSQTTAAWTQTAADNLIGGAVAVEVPMYTGYAQTLGGVGY